MMRLGGFVLTAIVLHSAPAIAEWKPAPGPLFTRWAKDVKPDAVLPEYPRPQLVRADWVNLNGLWSYAVRPRAEGRPQSWDGEILVPFAIESALSGVKRTVGGDNRLWYRRTFTTPAALGERRLLLHFGACDWETIVWVNSKPVAEHRGGYDPFTCDITGALSPQGEQEIVVAVWDPTDASYQPRGKQVNRPEGIWYTSVTGIWQTVWLEPVPRAAIAGVDLHPDIDAGVLRLRVSGRGTSGRESVEAAAFDGDKRVGSVTGKVDDLLELAVPGAKLWSPDSPFLYDLTVSLRSDGAAVDEVKSYFGMRKMAIAKDGDGFNRIFLNNQPVFQLGPLDQGWWPDGLYTAPTDEALRYDIEVTRRVGFNMARKHVKVEPDRWYYHCDKLGLLVWQDMPNGDRHIGPNQPDIERAAESSLNYFTELAAIMDCRRNHPSIVAWVPFNEGWGQFATDRVLAWTKARDPERIVDGPSGWVDRGTGDLNDMHRYPGPGMPRVEPNRAVVLGEFGGLGLPLPGHLWQERDNWGYRTYTTRDELRTQYALLYKKLHPLKAAGLAAAVYTQTTDVEGEVNGLMTYDRAVIKIDPDEFVKIHKSLDLPAPIITRREVLATSEGSAQTWRYTTEKPADGWEAESFDDAAWKQGPGGFGEASTPGAIVRTSWKTRDIWLRRTFELDSLEHPGLNLRVHHDEDAEVFINGKRVAALNGYESDYVDLELGKEARALLRLGKNTIAVHCAQTRGGQYIDVGLVEIKETPAAPAK